MKIKVYYEPHTEEVFVWGLWGKKTIEHCLECINKDIQEVNKSLRSLYE